MSETESEMEKKKVREIEIEPKRKRKRLYTHTQRSFRSSGYQNKKIGDRAQEQASDSARPGLGGKRK